MSDSGFFNRLFHNDEGTPGYVWESMESCTHIVISYCSYFMGVGAYHSGVAVYGHEYAFGGAESGTGVFSMSPGSLDGQMGLKLKDRVYLGTTSLKRKEVRDLVKQLQKEWPANSYSLLSRNCNHFSDELTHKLLPGWVNRAARIGSTFSCIMPAELVTPPPASTPSPSTSTSSSVPTPAPMPSRAHVPSASARSDVVRPEGQIPSYSNYVCTDRTSSECPLSPGPRR